MSTCSGRWSWAAVVLAVTSTCWFSPSGPCPVRAAGPGRVPPAVLQQEACDTAEQLAGRIRAHEPSSARSHRDALIQPGARFTLCAMSVRLSVELYIDNVWERQRGPERPCPGSGLHPAPMDEPGGDDHSV